MAACAVEDTNSNAEAVTVMKHLRALAEEFECAVLVLHHERKQAKASLPARDPVIARSAVVAAARVSCPQPRPAGIDAHRQAHHRFLLRREEPADLVVVEGETRGAQATGTKSVGAATDMGDGVRRARR